MRFYRVLNEHVSLLYNIKMVQGATLKKSPQISRAGFFWLNIYIKKIIIRELYSIWTGPSYNKH